MLGALSYLEWRCVLRFLQGRRSLGLGVFAYLPSMLSKQLSYLQPPHPSKDMLDLNYLPT
jgi:hypothetical protein